MKQDLGFDPTPRDELDLGGVLRDLQVVQGERAGRRPVRPRPPGQAARLADERLLQRAVGLRRRLLRGRRRRRAAAAPPTRASRSSTRPRRSRPRTSTASSSRSPTPAARAGTGTGSAPRSRPARWRWRVNWHEFAAGNEESKIKGKVGYARAPARARSAARTCTAAPGIGINGTAPEREQKAAWLFVNWATSPETQLANLKSEVGGGTPTRDSVYELPEVEKAKQAAVEDAEHPHGRRRVRGLEAREHRAAARRSPPGTSATRRSSPSSRRCWPASRAPRSA